MPEGDLPVDPADTTQPVPETTSAVAGDPVTAVSLDAAASPDADADEPLPRPAAQPKRKTRSAKRAHAAGADASLAVGAEPLPLEPEVLLPRVGVAVATKVPWQFAAIDAPPSERPAPEPPARGGLRRFGRRRSVAAAALLVVAVVAVAAGSFVISRGGQNQGATSSALAADLSTSARASAGPSSPPPSAASSASAPNESAPSDSAAAPLSATDGTVYFSDAFANPYSGWATDSTTDLQHTTLKFAAGGYVIGSTGGTMHHLVYAPFRTEKQQMSMTVTAALNGAPAGAGFGVTCRRSASSSTDTTSGVTAGPTEISYQFLVAGDGHYYIERRDGSPNLASEPIALARGETAYVPATTPMTVTGVCATMPDGVTTRLALFADGHVIADITDRAALPTSGWLGGILMSSAEAPSTMTATFFEERDLAR